MTATSALGVLTRPLCQPRGGAAEPIGHEAALDELRALPSRLDDPDHEVLTPADTCPDNNLLGAGAVHLLDFEHAELRDAAWHVAYCARRGPAAGVRGGFPTGPPTQPLRATGRRASARSHRTGSWTPADLHAGLGERWGALELDLAPAFRTGST